ncbi:pentatricopeptide repeat-containing protein At1g10910, chloroplastic [Cucurbita moschata]|uniref:Pentatricopeptide repeat-containing protein At1g10910, chloroplastic n=1 Tax=Cucurbita moschata TaxID=3662 RepID=A0A6J1ERS3_CUCMO|nr:pentatricopeptide repeat-containing protein At1g10910, chloroplastic [Cucurbita moschata]
MELSVIGNGYHRHLLQTRLPTPSSVMASAPHSVPRLKNHRPNSIAILPKQPQFLPDSPNGKLSNGGQRRHSKSYLERQSAIAQVKDCSELAPALARYGGLLKAQDLNVILRHFGMSSRWQDLSQLFEWMQQTGKTNVSSYSSYIKFMGRGLNPLKALEIYNNIQEVSIKNNIYICNSILNCLVRNGKFDTSVKLFHQMKNDGLCPDTVTYSTMLTGCIKVEHGYAKALELLKESQNNGLCMDSVSYGTLIAVCASHNRLEDAESFFNQMKNEGYSPNMFHYGSLLNAYSMSGDYKKADELIEDMKLKGLVPNKVILTTLLKVYVRGGLFEKSRKLLSELEALGYGENEMPYCLLMDGLSKAGAIREAKTVFDQMKEKNVKSDGYAHSIMISAFCRGGLLEEAKQLAKDFETTYDRYDIVILNTMLCAYCRAGEMESVMQMLRKMDELAISPDYNTFHILIKYFCKEKLYLLGCRTLEDMHRQGHQPDEELCSYLISSLGTIRAYSEAFSVYNILKYSKRTMCKALHEKILHILIAGRLLKDAYVVVKDNAGLISKPAIRKFAFKFMKFGNVNLINDVMKAIHCSGYKIDQDLFMMATSRFIELPEKKDLFIQLLQWMSGQGYVVDSSTRNLILKNSHLFGRQLIADILSKQHRVSKATRSHGNT